MVVMKNKKFAVEFDENVGGISGLIKNSLPSRVLLSIPTDKQNWSDLYTLIF